MQNISADQQIDSAINRSKSVLEQLTSTYFNGRSVVVLVLCLLAAFIIGRIIASLLRALARKISRSADRTESLQTANRLRRYETMIVITIALIKALLVALAFYLWWVFIHPAQQPTALVGASALLILVLSATVSPILRDLAYGGVMMAEHWFGVGDYVKVEPFGDMRGVVERVTLRSTRLRSLNGEVIWVSNQNIAAVRVVQRGVQTIALDLFFSDLKKGLEMLETANMQLPISQLTVIKPLHVMSETQVGPKLWHVIAVGETAPGREWMLEEYAPKMIKELDEENKHSVLATEPIARYADSEAERRFARTVQNARKSTLKRKRLPLPEALVEEISAKVGRSNKKSTTDKN